MSFEDATVANLSYSGFYWTLDFGRNAELRILLHCSPTPKLNGPNGLACMVAGSLEEDYRPPPRATGHECALCVCGFRGREFLNAAQLYLASRADDAVPRQLIDWVGAQQPSDSAVVAWIAGCGSDCAISAHVPGGNGKNHATESEITLLVWS